MNAQRGMTLIEVIVALLVLTVGLLGTASAAGAAARLINDAHRQSRFADTSAGLLEELRVTACHASDGSRFVAPFQFAWTVHSATPLAEVRLVGVRGTAPGSQQAVFVLARWCP